MLVVGGSSVGVIGLLMEARTGGGDSLSSDTLGGAVDGMGIDTVGGGRTRARG